MSSTQERTWPLPIAQKDCPEGSDRLGHLSKTGGTFLLHFKRGSLDQGNMEV